jgi:hypothetical protein
MLPAEEGPMTFDEFVAKGWQDHADDAAGVFARLPDGIALVTDAKHLPALAALIVHVAGEHLGRWDDGIALLGRLERLPVFDAASPAGKAVKRSQAVLHHCAGDRSAAERALAAGLSGGDTPEASDRIRVLAPAASALAFQNRDSDAHAALEDCVRLAAYGPAKQDPAARALAMTGNNVAVELENRASLDADGRALVVRAAEIGLRFWKVAGTWVEEDRAEYRLALANVKAGDGPTALRHAERCLAIVLEHQGDAYETFFAHEAVARSHLAAGDGAAARRARDAAAGLVASIADEGSRSYAEGKLRKLDATVAPK